MKVMNVVFGIGIAIILFIVVTLGVQVFYHAPIYEDFCNSSIYSSPSPVYDSTICSENITVRQCNLLVKYNQTMVDKQNEYSNECNKKFQEADNSYGKNLFLINNVLGIIFVIVSLFLFSMINIAAGTAFAGLVLIIWGFIRGWQGTGDVLKFIVALIVAVLFVYFAVVVNKRYSKPLRKR